VTQPQKPQPQNNEEWDGINDPPSSPFPKEVNEIDKAFVRTFSTEDGAKVLQHLKFATLDQPSWIPGNSPDQGYMREGQNSIVREIIARMRRATNG